MDTRSRTCFPVLVVILAGAIFVATMSYGSTGSPLKLPERASLVYAAPSPPERITIDPFYGIPVEDPSYSPDGREVAFSAKWGRSSEIFAVATIDGRLRTIVPEIVNPPPLLNVPGAADLAKIYGAAGPAWSPNGKWIAFPGIRLTTPNEPVAHSAIWLVHSDGSGLTPVRTSSLGAVREVAWSPDATQIAFTAQSDMRIMGGPH